MKMTQEELKKTYEELALQVNNFITSNQIIDEESLGKQKLLRIAELVNNKKSTKSKYKMPTELLNRSFVYPSENFTFGLAINKTGQMRTISLYRLKTSKGSIYISFYKGTNNEYTVLCFKAHVFDRYITRLKNDKIKDRTSAIKHFIHKLLQTETMSYRNETEDNGSSMIIILGNNFCLGLNFGKLKLINTFIEESMLTPRQKILMETMKKWNISNPPPSIAQE